MKLEASTLSLFIATVISQNTVASAADNKRSNLRGRSLFLPKIPGVEDVIPDIDIGDVIPDVGDVIPDPGEIFDQILSPSATPSPMPSSTPAPTRVPTPSPTPDCIETVHVAGYEYHPYVDSPGRDLDKATGNFATIAALCDEDPSCAGFFADNTHGWLKHTIRPMGEWRQNHRSDEPCLGMFIKLEPTPEPTASPTDDPTPSPTPTPTAGPTSSPTSAPVEASTPVPSEIHLDAGEAESCNLKTNHDGFNGEGFCDFEMNGDWIEWVDVEVPSTGTYRVEMRYSSANSRALELHIDSMLEGTFGVPETGSWTVWKTEALTVSVSAGTHTIRLYAATSTGPNVDEITLVPVEA